MMKRIVLGLVTGLCLNFSLVAQVNFDLVGFATQNGGTTGGKGGQTVTATSYSQLKSYAESSNTYVIMVEGTISNGTGGGAINIKSNKSIIGVGSTAFLSGVGLAMSSGDNIIIQNLKLTLVGTSNPSGVNGGDCISISGSSNNIWVDHCEMYSENPDVQKDIDKYDGLLDIKHQTGFITISWCYFHDHHKCTLVGSADDDLFADRKVTFHHNYYKKIKYRIPMYRGAIGHFFNNYIVDAQDASEIRNGTCVRVEKNYYESFHYAIYTPTDAKGNTERIDNYLGNTQSRAYPANCVANIPYTYSNALTNNVNDVKTVVSQYAGVGKVGEIKDCNGVTNGSAYLDQCAICVGGTTGKTACVKDCNGDISGTAKLDACGVCTGGKTANKVCSASLEAEKACTMDGTIDSDNAGYSGTGFVNTTNTTGAYASWILNSTSNQTVTLSFKYANGGTGARNGSLKISGVSAGNLILAPTGSWATWQMFTINVPFKSGSNEIIATATSADGLANIDLLSFSAGVSDGKCLITNIYAETSEVIGFYPNPAEDKLHLSKFVQWEVLDVHGISISKGESDIIDVQNFASGVYFVNINGTVAKFVKK